MQITHEPKVTHHSWIHWQWLIYLSCPQHMPQLESHFLQTHCSLFSSIFLGFHSGWLQQCCTLGALSLPPGPFWSQNIAFRFWGECKRNLGQGLHIASWWWAILLNGSQYGVTLFRKCQKQNPSELQARPKRLHYGMWDSFCHPGSDEKSDGISDTTTNIWNGYETTGNVVSLAGMLVIAWTCLSGHITFL